MDEVEVPNIYVVNRRLPIEEAYPVIRALSITPVQCAVISDVLDAALALSLSPSIAMADTDKDALALAGLLAEDANRPVLVVGEANFLDAIYATGRREAVATQC